MRPGDRLELLDALELAVERAGVREITAIDDFYRAELTKDVTRQPHLAVAPTADAAEQFVVGNDRPGKRDWKRGALRRWRLVRAR
jgi:hypothetical protein